MAAHIYVDGKEYELPDVTHVQLAHTESAGGTMISLRTHDNQVLGYLNVGPGCFVTVGNPPTKVAKTLTLTKVGSVLTLNIPDTEPLEQSEHASPLGAAAGALARKPS
jgi:hypothetical protein